MLDAGCGSGRLTVALAEAGAAVTGFDTSLERLDQARRRAAEHEVGVEFVEADFNEPLPFAEASFDAATSRLALMAAADPVVTLRELRRLLGVGGRMVTSLWASPSENPWFAEPRAAVASVLGAERGAFARAFGKLGDADEAGRAHRDAGFRDVVVHHVRGHVEASSAQALWQDLAHRIGHFERLDAELDVAQRDRVVAELDVRCARFRVRGQLALPRTQVIVTARREIMP